MLLLLPKSYEQEMNFAEVCIFDWLVKYSLAQCSVKWSTDSEVFNNVF